MPPCLVWLLIVSKAYQQPTRKNPRAHCWTPGFLIQDLNSRRTDCCQPPAACLSDLDFDLLQLDVSRIRAAHLGRTRQAVVVDESLGAVAGDIVRILLGRRLHE